MKDHKNLFCIAAIMIVTAAVFLPSLQNGFTTLDDDVMVTGNPLIRGLSPAPVQKMFTAPFNGLYHPLVLLSYAVEYRFFGLDARAYHATNLVLHLANALLVFWLFLMLSRSRAAAAVTAFLFAVHPMHVESVAWISERKDVLYALFFLGSAVAYLSWREHGRARYYLLSVVLFLASLLSKPMAITLPAVLMLADWYRGRKLNGQTLRELLPFWALAMAFGLVSVLVHYRPEGAPAAPAVSAAGGLVTACNTVVFYLARLALPVKLSCYYPYTGASWSGYYPFAAAGMLGAAAAAALAAYLSRKTRFVGFGCALFIVMLLPVLQVVPVGQEVPADRYTYLPSLGLFFIAGAVFAAALEKGKTARFAASALAVLVVVPLSFLSAKRCTVWKDGVTLWSDVVAQFDSDPKAYRCRADAYKEARDYAAAFGDYDRAIALKPDYAAAYNNRGNAFSDIGDRDRAIVDYSRALAIDPGYKNARYNRGAVYAGRGEHDKALQDYGTLIENGDGNADVRNNRGVVYAKMGRYPQAIEDFSAALSLEPDLREAYVNRAAAFCMRGDRARALDDIAWLERNGFPVSAALKNAFASTKTGGGDRQARQKKVK